MSLEERLEKAEKLVAEVKAELAAMRVTKRNWPERIEAGDCFEQANGSRYLVCGSKFVNLDTGALWLLGGGPSGNDKIDLSYLGKIDLTIRTDAHEPTGAELAFPTDPPLVSVPLTRRNDIFGAIRWYDSSAYWNNKMQTLSRELKDEDARLAK